MEQPRNIAGAEIRRLRDAKGISQQALASRVALMGYNLTRGTLAKIEAGIRSISDIELFLISHALNMETDRLRPKDFFQKIKKGEFQPFHTRKKKR